MENFKYDDSKEVSIMDTDLVNQDPESIEGWDKDQSGEVYGETEAEVRFTTKKEDDRFSAPYQEGWVQGGSVYRCVDELRVFVADKDITELLTDKCLDRLRERLDEDMDQED